MGGRLPKRWLSFMTVSLALLTILYLFNTSGSLSYKEKIDGSDGRSKPETLSSSSILPSSYLLGSEEDATKLWFPPPSSLNSHFQPAVASYNQPPPMSDRPRTPLFIAFTRNSAMLQQTLLSYIAAGWPREDIIVVDNSGTMDANARALLSASNPFHLDYALLRTHYGVSVLQTPVLLNFAQLQNFFLRTAMAHDWRVFFWSHMDVAVLSDEGAGAEGGYKSFYARVLDILADLGVESLTGDFNAKKDTEKWAIKYFTYDWLTLVNVEAWRAIGAWDVFIPFYTTDCDAYSRLAMHGFIKGDVRAGRIFDLASAIADPETKFFPSSQNDDNSPNSPRYRALVAELEALEAQKPESQRNHWQDAQGLHGAGEPWTYDPRGFQSMWWATAEKGRDMYRLKWGTMECRLDEHGYSLKDAWKGE